MRTAVKVICLIIVVAVCLGGYSHITAAQEKGSFAIILQAGTESHEGLARTVHALMYSKELAESGYEVVLIFDGAGTTWARELRKKDNKLHSQYTEIARMGITEEICDFCAGAFKVKEALAGDKDAALIAAYNGHPSIVKWIEKGYRIIVL